MSWAEKTTVKKGSYAEGIVNRFLEEKGYVVYEPTTEKAHAFDRLAVKNKQEMLIVECKAKAKRNYYDDTGVNINHYEAYKKIQEKHTVPLMLVFIDEMLGKIYGGFLDKIETPTIEKTRNGEKHYPSRENGIIYFPLSLMTIIKNLSVEEAQQLKDYSTRNYDYKQAFYRR